MIITQSLQNNGGELMIDKGLRRISSLCLHMTHKIRAENSIPSMTKVVVFPRNIKTLLWEKVALRVSED